MADLTRPVVNDKSLTICSWDALQNLRDRTYETTQLVVMSDNKCLILEQCISDQPIKVSGKVGMLFLVIPVPRANQFSLTYPRKN